MARKNRVVAPAPNTVADEQVITSDDLGSSTPLLQHVTDGATIQDLNPDACIPLGLVRKIINNAVLKLRAVISGKSESRSNGLPGMVAGTPSCCVIPLVGEHEHLLDEWIDSRCKTAEEAKQYKELHPVWFGIVDGCQLHAAIQSEREGNESKWNNFKWRVLVLKPSNSYQVLRRFARVQNEGSKAFYQFECTIYDLLSGLRLDYDELYQKKLKESRTGERGVNVTHREVAHSYDGGSHLHNSSVKQAVSVASRLSIDTIEAIGKVVNSDCPDMIF